jgi:flagellar hook assembly protein FlgD
VSSRPHLSSVELRDLRNQPIGSGIDAGQTVEDNPSATGAFTRLHLVAQPNPATSTTVISLGLPAAASVSLKVYDVKGRLVRMLVDEPLSAGEHRIVWDRLDGAGRQAAPGIYIAILRAGETSVSQKLLLLP